jgi:hypothetical protein
MTLFFKQTILALMIAVIVSGCLVNVGGNTRSTFTKLDSIPCSQKPEKVYLFFENEAIDFEYQKIGLVSVEGGIAASETDVLDRLKFEARNVCANAVIQVAGKQIERTESKLFDSSTNEKYNAIKYYGIAVKIKVDEKFLAKYGGGVDLKFVDNVNADSQRASNAFENQCALSVISILVGLVVGVILILEKK